MFNNEEDFEVDSENEIKAKKLKSPKPIYSKYQKELAKILLGCLLCYDFKPTEQFQNIINIVFKNELNDMDKLKTTYKLNEPKTNKAKSIKPKVVKKKEIENHKLETLDENDSDFSKASKPKNEKLEELKKKFEANVKASKPKKELTEEENDDKLEERKKKLEASAKAKASKASKPKK